MKILKITFREQGYKAHHLGNMDPREGLITLDKRKYQIDIFCYNISPQKYVVGTH